MTNPYDEVPYDGAAQRFVHPDKLAAMAILHGLDPAPPRSCRILEIGCAAGETLVPLAEALPGSELVGIDYSARQVEAGQRAIAASGLANVRIEQLDVTEAGPELGTFDYIICHGMYSWVPPLVRDRLLALCKTALNPGGVVYMSFNAKPGALFKQYVRDMMLFHTAGIAAPQERVQEGVRLAGIVNDSVAPASPLGALLAAYAPEMRERAGPAILHDELGDVNEGFYFSEFLAEVRQHGLEYLSDVEHSVGATATLPKPMRDVIEARPRSFEEVEQYTDFFLCRYFRRALLCHPDTRIVRDVKPTSALFERLWLCSPARKVEGEQPRPGRPADVVTFRRESGETLATNHPPTIAALTILGQAYPHAIAYPELMQRAAAETRVAEADFGQHSAIFAMNLLASLSKTGELVSLSAGPDSFTTDVSERPFAAASARLAAERGELTVPNVRLDLVELDQVSLRLLILCDGRRDHAELLAGFRRLVKRDFEGAPLPEAEDVQRLLQEFAQSALLLR